MEDSRKKDKMRGAFVGLAVGDALGAPVQFMERGTFPRVTGMRGGAFGALPAGTWTDDTAMALCLAYSIGKCRGLDTDDQMAAYADWLQNGFMSSIGEAFDVGNCTYRAISAYIQAVFTGRDFEGVPFGCTYPDSAGNGSIMRLAPVPIVTMALDFTTAMHWAASSSRVTHAHPEAVDGARLLTTLVRSALIVDGSERAKSDRRWVTDSQGFATEFLATDKMKGLARELPGLEGMEEDIVPDSTYVYDTLKAAVWAFVNTTSFEECRLTAVNLGGDADSIGAVAGQIAGAFYGYSAIPGKWIDVLARRTLVEDAATRLAELYGTITEDVATEVLDGHGDAA
ncbi:MAG: ADP-ribosylglycohydrolase family protein [Caldilinea sp.]|nr:ADP-ribosylglycohydrolase family protein [Caldilinea sp.]